MTKLRLSPAARVARECLHELHPDDAVCRRRRIEAERRERVLADLFARAHALIERAEVLVEVGDPDDELDEVFNALAEHKVLIHELLDE
jgi:hypothetical protein